MQETQLRCNRETREISHQQIKFITKTIWKKLPSRLEFFRLERVSLSEQDNMLPLGLGRLIIWPPIHVAGSKARRWGLKQGTPSNGLYGETLPEGGTFFKSLVDQKYMKMWGNMSFLCKRKRLINPSSWNFKSKGMQCHSLEMLKGYNWSIEGIRNGYLTGQKCWLKGKGMNFGTLPPLIELCWVPPPPRV